MGRVEGKIAIVTGAASGIGAATAQVLAREGASVVVADLNRDGAVAHAKQLAAEGGAVIGIGFDLGDPKSIESLVAETVSAFGGIDVLHNNAAATHLAATRDGPIMQAEPGVWEETFRINVLGTALMIKAVVPHLLERGGGSIVNTSSGAGLAGDLGHAAYGASKAAINAVTRYAATELGKLGIRVNAVSPGLIETSAAATSGFTGELRDIMLANHLTPRLGTPEDIANAVLFLASDDSTFMTGQVLGVDGGVLAHAPYYSELMARFASS
jgi:NAD(P)-dependent dehydrogenase (short-subunit alcohol dehydrogenase family)